MQGNQAVVLAVVVGVMALQRVAELLGKGTTVGHTLRMMPLALVVEAQGV
jgi:hypothetical protein